MITLKELFSIKIGPPQPKPLSEMSNSELQVVIDRKSRIMAAQSNFPGSPEYRKAHKDYTAAHEIIVMRLGLRL